MRYPIPHAVVSKGFSPEKIYNENKRKMFKIIFLHFINKQEK
jgi:hypothetical protein